MEEIIWNHGLRRVRPVEKTGILAPLSSRSIVTVISVISLVSCALDMVTVEPAPAKNSEATDHLESFRTLILALFVLANFMLLLGAIIECTFLINVYVWYALAFVVMGLMVSLVDFLLRVQRDSALARAWLIFVPEVAFLFVLFRCLPLVDKYGKELEEVYILEPTSVSTV